MSIHGGSLSLDNQDNWPWRLPMNLKGFKIVCNHLSISPLWLKASRELYVHIKSTLQLSFDHIGLMGYKTGSLVSLHVKQQQYCMQYKTGWGFGMRLLNWQWLFHQPRVSTSIQYWYHTFSTHAVTKLMNTLPKLLSNYCIPQLHKRNKWHCMHKSSTMILQTYQDQKIKKENSFCGHLTEEVTVPVSIETQFLLLLKQGWTGE